MPIFEYRCEHCETTFEVLHRGSEANTAPECPCCNTRNTKRRLSAFATAGSQKETASDTAT